MQIQLWVTLVTLLLLSAFCPGRVQAQDGGDYFSAGQYGTRQNGVTIYSKDTDPPWIHYHHARSADTPDYMVFIPYPERNPPPYYPIRRPPRGWPVQQANPDDGPQFGIPPAIANPVNPSAFGAKPGITLPFVPPIWLHEGNPDMGLLKVQEVHAVGGKRLDANGFFSTNDPTKLTQIIYGTILTSREKLHGPKVGDNGRQYFVAELACDCNGGPVGYASGVPTNWAVVTGRT